MNEMVNAVGLDIGAMVIPRAYYDTTHRNEYAGAETFFREASGTFINCLSAGVFAKLITMTSAISKTELHRNSCLKKYFQKTFSIFWARQRT